ncbi:MAG TPA: ribosome maturation factor RimP [Ilumatobacter sp.]|nr:ribosome maturation factor RimP [Ilumatobacter sp.]
MAGNTTDTPVIRRVRALVEPIASDLQLDLYDIEQRGGTMRVTLDTPPGSEASVDLDQLALATRLISRELDHQDPIPGRYTLEVTSPGVERALRTPAHFQRELGKPVSVRLADVTAEQRRFEGVLVAADDTTATIRVVAGSEIVDRVVDLASIDRARTIFEWGPQPKPGGKGAPKQRPEKQTTKHPSKPSKPKQKKEPS